jgi:DNA-binding MarR family transcriptional regulator
MEGKSRSMKKSHSEDKDFNLWVMLEQARTAVGTARDKELYQYKVSFMKAAVLYIVNAIGSEATPAEISRWILRRSHSVSGLLERMEKDGLIKKAKDLPRRNLVRVTLTDKGKQILKETTKRESIHNVMSVLSASEQEQLYSMLQRLRDRALKETITIPTPPFP